MPRAAPRPILTPDTIFPARWPALAARHLTLGSGLHVRVVEAGPDDGPPVLALHGWGCSAYTFRHILPALGAGGYRAIALDLPGHGLSDKPADPAEYTKDSLAVRVVSVMDALQIPRATLLGHSMGGAVALQVAMRAPGRVDGLVLLASVGLGDVWGIPVFRRTTPKAVVPVAQWLFAHFGRGIVAAVLRALYTTHDGLAGCDVEEYLAPVRTPGMVAAARALVVGFDWSPTDVQRLREVNVPILAMYGTRDRLVRWRELSEGLRAVPHLRVRAVQGAGHLLAEEAAAEVTEATQEFLRANVGSHRPDQPSLIH